MSETSRRVRDGEISSADAARIIEDLDNEVDCLTSVLASEKDHTKRLELECLDENGLKIGWQERAEKAEKERDAYKSGMEVNGNEAYEARLECSKLIEKLNEAQGRLDATFIAALRYESLHDRDPERGRLWGELKMALMVSKLSQGADAPCVTQGTEKP